MSINNLEEKFELVREALLKFDRKNIIKENTIEEDDTVDRKDIIKKNTIKENTTDAELRKFVILSDVTLKKYHKFCKKYEMEKKKFNIYIRLVKGEIIAYEIPNTLHACIVGELGFIIGSWSNHLEILNNLDIIVGNNSEYCSDIAIEPMQPIQFPLPESENVSQSRFENMLQFKGSRNRNRGKGRRSKGKSRNRGKSRGSCRNILQPKPCQPRIIVEVGIFESIESLNYLVEEYFSAYRQTNLIQIYLLIKIFPRRVDGTVAMLAILYLRNNQIPNITSNTLNSPAMITVSNIIPNLVISFGTAPLHQDLKTYINNTGIRNDRFIGFLQTNDIACTSFRLPDYQITIPSNLIFNGFPGGVPQGTPNHFNLDLWEIQQRILRRIY